MNPKVSVLLATYSNDGTNQEYLDLCLESLDKQVFKEFEVILISSGSYIPKQHDMVDVHQHINEQTHYPKAVSLAYEASNKDSEFILFLNDDVILNKYCIEHLYEGSKLGNFLLNCMSNCDDNGRFYSSIMPYIKLQYRIDEMKQLAESVITKEDLYPPLLVFQNIIHLYCTMVRRSDYEQIGKIDKTFLTGFDDTDLSLRAVRLGIRPAFLTNAYALHGSGVTADKYLTNEQREFNHKYFESKHGIKL